MISEPASVADREQLHFTVLSHAGIAVGRGRTQLLIDPWIVGSCYWRSWWNLPEPPRDLIESLAPTHIHLTHLHWDHFHGPSLRRFDRSTPIIVPTFNNDRMKRDLAYLGFENVVELRHGQSVDLGDGLRLQSYQFLNDSAAVVSDGETTLLDANDCKMFGLPLGQVLDDHPSIDFVFRSHSNASAYPYCIEDFETVCPDLRPREAYMDEFAAFTRAVGARYAVPFASNHCFLHPETKKYNGLAVLPNEVKARFDEIGGPGECVIMAPGSSWSAARGFEIAAFDYADVDSYIEALAGKHDAKVAEQLAKEQGAVFDVAAFASYFERFTDALPRLAKRKVGTFEFRIVEHGVERPFTVDTRTRMVTEGGVADPSFSIRCQAAVVNDCTRHDMFSVWTPSKRLSVRVRDRDAVSVVLLFFSLLDGLELEYLPVRRNFRQRMLGAGLRRWREPAQLLRTAIETKVLRRPFTPWPS